jgi:hypothetical protein
MIDRELGNFTVDQITSSLLVQYRDNRLKIASNQTVKHEIGLIRRAMRKGIEWGIVNDVPFVLDHNEQKIA